MKIIFVLLCLLLSLSSAAKASFLEDFLKGVQLPQESQRDSDITIAGLKEALSIGTNNAILSVSKVDGYFKNEAIKILLPKNIQNIANVLSKIGYQKEVDEFILSMNKAAEKAAPKPIRI